MKLHKSLTVADWPNGLHRTEARFEVERTSRGERVARRTKRKDGTWSQPKRTAYCPEYWIATDDDGMVSLIGFDAGRGSFTITPGTMRTASYVFSPGEEYQRLLAFVQQTATRGEDQ